MIKNIVYNPTNIQFNDWREDLLTKEIVIGSSRSFNDALVKTISFFLDNYLTLLLAHLEKYSLIDSYIHLIRSKEQVRHKLHSLWLHCWTTTMKTIDMSVINRNNIEIPLVFDLHLPCATIEYTIICQIRENIAQDNSNENKNRLDHAWKELTNKSIYGSFISKIFNDKDLFQNYFHDQLTLVKNNGNIHVLSTSFIQNLLTSKISGTIKDQLKHLLIDYEELFVIMQIFEIGTPLIDEEDRVFEILDRQFIIKENSIQTNNNNHKYLYYLILEDTYYYLIPPKLLANDRREFDCQSNPFIEISLINLIELLMSQSVINTINNIEQFILKCSLISQNLIKLSSYKHYEIINLEKFHSFLHLVSSMLTLFPNEKALIVFKTVYLYSDFWASFKTVEQIDSFICYLKNVIDQQRSIVDKSTIQQILNKLENELSRNWLIENSDQHGDIVKFISNDKNDLWKYAGKIFTVLDRSFVLSSEDLEEINRYLSEVNDPTRKIELIMTTRIYINLILYEDCTPRITEETAHKIIQILKQDFDQFKTKLSFVENQHNNETKKLELINSIAWLKYYLLYYVYALQNDDKDQIMEKINSLLVDCRSTFSSTLKLFIIKQLCQVYNITFHEFNQQFIHRNIPWIHSITTSSPPPKISNARCAVILPTPLFEYHDEFIRIDNILSSSITRDKLSELIKECTTRQDTSYCFIIWFIHYYSRFYMSNISPDNHLVNLIENDLKKELTTCFEPIGYKLIVSLCSNFHEKSYFQLKPSLPGLYQRLSVLNIIALLLSFKSLQFVSLLGFLLYDENRQMPNNYFEHLKKFDSLLGVAAANDHALIQMLNIRTNINESNHIIRCSSTCMWIFYLKKSDIFNEQQPCPLCNNKLNISLHDDLLVIKPPHIGMDTDDTLQFINDYIERHKDKEKDNQLTSSISYHFINILTHSVFLFLNELNFIPNSTIVNSMYYQERIENHYKFLRKYLSNIDQCYIWIYKLINHMINKDFAIQGYLNSPEKVIELEQIIEKKLILPHINSIVHQIREYKLLYTDFIYGNDKHNILDNFVDELVEDNEKYPLLNFFNLTNIHSIDLIEDFHFKLQLQEKTYPLTTFLLQHLSDYDNIQYLYPIIKFTNYFLQHFNHRIERNDAKKKTISDYLKIDNDLEVIYKTFLDSWRKINLKEVYFNNKKYDFQSKSNFNDQTNLSMFLLNKSNNNENLLLIVCLQTLSNFQNDIINCSQMINSNRIPSHIVPIQSIDQKHLFDFNTNSIRKLLIKKGLIINYTYGMGKDIIYDYDEIEWTLRNQIGCLPLIDIKNMRYFNYQFELYDENSSLINDIRQRFEQKLFDNHTEIEIKKFINSLDNDSILQLSALLEYILTYLRTVTNNDIIKTSTIYSFINEHIQSKIFLPEKRFDEKLLSSIHLTHTIDLYELIEECIFDKIFSKNIRTDLSEQSFPSDQRTLIINQFIDQIFNNKNIAECFKDLNCWINMFKRLLVRLLSPKIDIKFDTSLEDFIKRIDMWKGNITKDDIQTITIKRNIQLKHMFIILKGLEAKKEEKNQDSQNKNISERISITSPTSSSSQRSNKPRRRNDLRE